MERQKLTRRENRKLGYVLSGVVSLALALMFWVGNYIENMGQDGGRNRGFRGDPVAVIAEVGVKEVQDTNYYVRLRYEVQNADGTSEFVNSADYISEADFEYLEEGGQVSIEYDSESHLDWRLSDPAPASTDAVETDEFSYSAGFFLVVSAVSFGMLFLMMKAEGDAAP